MLVTYSQFWSKSPAAPAATSTICDLPRRSNGPTTPRRLLLYFSLASTTAITPQPLDDGDDIVYAVQHSERLRVLAEDVGRVSAVSGAQARIAATLLGFDARTYLHSSNAGLRHPSLVTSPKLLSRPISFSSPPLLHEHKTSSLINNWLCMLAERRTSASHSICDTGRCCHPPSSPFSSQHYSLNSSHYQQTTSRSKLS